MYVFILVIVAYLLLGTKKGRAFLSAIFSKIVESSLKIIIYIIIIGAFISLVISTVKWVLDNIGLSILLSVIVFAALIVFSSIQEKKHKEKHAKVLEEWKKSPSPKITDLEISNILSPICKTIFDTDKNSVKFIDDIPYGRVKFFINFFNRDIDAEEPLYFSPVRSNNKDELREYGLAITTSGIYISYQTAKTTKEGISISKDIFLPFSGMISDEKYSNTFDVDYVEYNDNKTIQQKFTTVPIDSIKLICDEIITKNISNAIYNNTLVDVSDLLENAEEDFEKNNNFDGNSKAIETAGVVSALPSMNAVYDEVGYTMGKRQGHGDAAEYANTAIDRITGDPKAEHLGIDNQKDGADRVTHRFNNEVLIQSKYCKTPNETINNAFLEHDYPNDMKIEVPRDQYNKCVEELQNKINKGELESKGISKGSDAKNYLVKGRVTYTQAYAIAKSGSIEGLVIDTLQGISCSALSGGVTAVITFAYCKWNGMETSDAAIASLKESARVVGKSTAIYVITMQLGARSEFINFKIYHAFKKMYKKSPNSAIMPSGIKNPFYAAGNKLANYIKDSNAAKSAIGKKIGLDKITGQKIIGGVVTATVTFGPDIMRALVGRISVKQLAKNSAVGAAGIVGATIGQSIIPIPVVGSMIGGSVAGFIAKKTLDNFIEDDAIEMFAILKEEFMDIIPLVALNPDELNEVIQLTLTHKKLSSLLRDMYAYGDSREYARINIVLVAVQSVISKRENITNEQFEDAFVELALGE